MPQPKKTRTAMHINVGGISKWVLTFSEEQSEGRRGNIYMRPTHGRFFRDPGSTRATSRPIQSVHVSFHPTQKNHPHDTIKETIDFHKNGTGAITTYHKTQVIKRNSCRFAPILTQVCGDLRDEKYNVNLDTYDRSIWAGSLDPSTRCLISCVFLAHPTARFRRLPISGIDQFHLGFNKFSVVIINTQVDFPSTEPVRAVIRTEPRLGDLGDQIFHESLRENINLMKNGLDEIQCQAHFMSQVNQVTQQIIGNAAHEEGRADDPWNIFIQSHPNLVGFTADPAQSEQSEPEYLTVV